MNRVLLVMTAAFTFVTMPAMAQYADPNEQPDAGAAVGAAIVGGVLGGVLGAALGGHHGHDRVGIADHMVPGGKKGGAGHMGGGHMGGGKPGGGMHKHKPGT